jgi:hypothetical protein
MTGRPIQARILAIRVLFETGYHVLDDAASCDGR